MVALCLGGAAAVFAADAPKQATVQTRLKRVALFKNGFGFFVREGTLTEDKQVAVLGPFAAPAHGTFWVSAPGRVGFASAVVREVAGSEDAPAVSIQELLRGNVGKQVKLWMYGQPEPSVTGTILAFAPDRPQPPIEPYSMGTPREIFPPGMGEYVLLKTDDGILALQPGNIVRASFTEGAPVTTFPRPSSQIQIEAAFNTPMAGNWLSVSYLAKGIAWAPSYLIDITDPKQARLSAKALIVNEAEPLEGAHVDLVTGFPHLQFADVLSPVAMKGGLGQLLQSLARGGTPSEAPSVMTQAVMYNRMEVGYAGGGMSGGGPAIPSYGAAADGQTVDDLFFYPLENVTLKKNETGYYPLFSESVPYTEFYEWKIPDYVNAEGYYAREGQTQQPEIVWHSLRLTNSMGMPWTTAPAQLMKDGQIIGQDTLNYTAPSGKSTVKITQAAGVKAEQNEVEIARQREAVQLYGHSFDRVTVKGTLQVTNYTKEQLALEVTKTLSGEVKQTSPKAEDVTLAKGLKAMNPMHELTWKLDVKAGESIEVMYTYNALIRR
jgi:hypothetical protein